MRRWSAKAVTGEAAGYEQLRVLTPQPADFAYMYECATCDEHTAWLKARGTM